ncbi:unnamed protein product, partial [Polarella glacialis]
MLLPCFPVPGRTLHPLAKQKAQGQHDSHGPSNPKPKSRRTAICKAHQEADTTAEGSKQRLHSSPVLQQLLALGQAPSLDEVSDIVSVELRNWTRNPRHATALLSSLARHRLPRIARH